MIPRYFSSTRQFDPTGMQPWSAHHSSRLAAGAAQELQNKVCVRQGHCALHVKRNHSFLRTYFHHIHEDHRWHDATLGFVKERARSIGCLSTPRGAILGPMKTFTGKQRSIFPKFFHSIVRAKPLYSGSHANRCILFNMRQCVHKYPSVLTGIATDKPLDLLGSLQ